MGSVIRSAYAWLLLSLIVLPLFPVSWLLEKLWHDPDGARMRLLVARWASLYTRLTPLYRYRVEGRDRIPAVGPYVLVANHESGLDVLSIFALRLDARFLADAWLFRLPLAGSLMRRCRHIPVDPERRESGRRALAEVDRVLADGAPVVIFPEGRLTPDGLGELRPGAFVAARRAGVPIVPVLLEGSGDAWRPGTLIVRGQHAIRIAVLPPIEAAEVKARDVEALSERVRAALVAARTRAGAVSPGPSARGQGDRV